MQLEEELRRIKELTGTDSISDSLDLLHEKAIQKLENCKKEYDSIALYRKYFLLMHPIGSIYFSTSEVNPEEIYGGKWESYAEGRVIVCADQTDHDFDSAEYMGGEETLEHVHTVGAHMHNLSHTHQMEHEHSYHHKHEIRAPHAHTMYHQHNIPVHSHTAIPHQHTMTQTTLHGSSVKISKPMYGQLYHTSYESTYWILSKEKGYLMDGDTTTINTVEQTQDNTQSISSYDNKNVTSDAINTLYSNKEALYLCNATEERHDTPIDRNGNSVTELKEETVWSGACTMDGQSLNPTIVDTIQPYITCYIFKRIE